MWRSRVFVEERCSTGGLSFNEHFVLRVNAFALARQW
ncbi:unnamed protein product [Brassica oleracea var. botrytis]